MKQILKQFMGKLIWRIIAGTRRWMIREISYHREDRN